MTVACVFVRGNYPYTLEYVVRLERMVRKHLQRPFRFVCLTDRSPAVRAAGIEAIPIAKLQVDQAYWHKVHLFRVASEWVGRVLFLDLDVLVVDDLLPIVDYPATFAICEDEMAREKPAVDMDSAGRQILRRFNASVIAWNAGAAQHLWNNWTPAVAKRLQGDQDWYAEQMPDAAAMPYTWFPRLSRLTGPPPFPMDTKVVLAKKPKNHLAAQQYPWFAPLWGAT